FAGLTIDRPGTGYTFVASSPGLTSATSNAFNVTLTFMTVSAGGSFHPTLSSGHTCGVTTAGIGYCWGANSFGQLGNGTTTDSSRPVPVSGLAGVTAIAAGGFHCLARLSDGTVKSWGNNSYGQLGNGSTTNRSTPAFVVTGSFGAMALRNVAFLDAG
ncbi:hypothetical protein QML11_28140, partial [Klebsiella pneumoniae]|uniref:RCC1 domain-containing protein n=1 Tax=Klebsiella pneumoniae TaxID=573 RepID=UPI003A885C16